MMPPQAAAAIDTISITSSDVSQGKCSTNTQHAHDTSAPKKKPPTTARAVFTAISPELDSSSRCLPSIRRPEGLLRRKRHSCSELHPKASVWMRVHLAWLGRHWAWEYKHTAAEFRSSCFRRGSGHNRPGPYRTVGHSRRQLYGSNVRHHLLRSKSRVRKDSILPRSQERCAQNAKGKE